MIEEKITKILVEPLESLGFDIVKVTLSGSSRKILEILIDRLDANPVTVGDCALASRNISAILDVEDLLYDKYFLEVGSAGVERPLNKLADYERFVGRTAKIALHEQWNDIQSCKAIIKAVNGSNILVEFKGQDLSIPFELIKNARLVFTDKLFKELLNKTQNKTQKSGDK